MAKWKSDGKNLIPMNDAAKAECAKRGFKGAIPVLNNPGQPMNGIDVVPQYIKAPPKEANK